VDREKLKEIITLKNIFKKRGKNKIVIESTCKHEYIKQVGFTNLLKCLECQGLFENPDFPKEGFDWMIKI
jgi:hypothetical protein